MYFESITSLWFFLWHNLFIPWIKRFIYRGVCGAWMRSRNYGNQQNEEVPLEWSSVGSNETYTSSILSISIPNNTNRYRKCWNNKSTSDSRSSVGKRSWCSSHLPDIQEKGYSWMQRSYDSYLSNRFHLSVWYGKGSQDCWVYRWMAYRAITHHPLKHSPCIPYPQPIRWNHND